MEKIRIIFDGHEIEVESDKVATYKQIELDFESKQKTEGRREKRAREQVEAGITPYPTFVAVAPDPLEALVVRDRNDQIYKAINKLPKRQKEMVEKVILDKRTMADVAKETGLTAPTVRITLLRGLKNLKKILLTELGD